MDQKFKRKRLNFNNFTLAFFIWSFWHFFIKSLSSLFTTINTFKASFLKENSRVKPLRRASKGNEKNILKGKGGASNNKKLLLD